MQFSVLVVEDDNLTRSLLVSLLRANRIDVVAEAASAAQVWELTADRILDAALLDLDLGPGPNGLDVARALRERNPHIGLVILTSYDDPRVKDPSGLIPRGLVYLTKRDGTDASAVLSALRQAMSSPSASTVIPRTTTLTPTQIDVLTKVASGETTAQIAAERGVTSKAVEQVISRLCEILDVPRDPNANPRVHLTRRYHELTGRLP